MQYHTALNNWHVNFFGIDVYCDHMCCGSVLLITAEQGIVEGVEGALHKWVWNTAFKGNITFFWGSDSDLFMCISLLLFFWHAVHGKFELMCLELLSCFLNNRGGTPPPPLTTFTTSHHILSHPFKHMHSSLYFYLCKPALTITILSQS